MSNISIVNLTNPGADPVDGDLIEQVYENGARVKKTFHVDVIEEPTHIEDFMPSQLHESFTSDEALAALSSSNAQVRTQVELLSMKRNKPINKDDAGYQSAINLLESDGVISADNAADYRDGIPVERLGQ